MIAQLISKLENKIHWMHFVVYKSDNRVYKYYSNNATNFKQTES